MYHQLWLLKPSGRSEHLEEVEYTSFTEGCRASMSCVRHSTPEPARRSICSHLQQCKLERGRVSQPIHRQLNIPKQDSHHQSTEVPRVMPKAWPLQWFLSFTQWHSQVINNLPLPWAEDAKLRTSAEREDDHNTTVRINTKWVYFQSSHFESEKASGEVERAGAMVPCLPGGGWGLLFQSSCNSKFQVH